MYDDRERGDWIEIGTLIGSLESRISLVGLRDICNSSWGPGFVSNEIDGSIAGLVAGHDHRRVRMVVGWG